MNETNHSDQQGDGSPLRFRLGCMLIGLSGVLWFSLFAIPWFPISRTGKATVAAGMFVGVQIAWWGGAALVGPAAIKRMFAWFRRSHRS